MPVTKRQREVLDFVGEFIERRGYAPSLEEIGRGLKLSSVSTVHKHLKNLEAKGMLSREWNRSRSLTVTPPPAKAGAVNIPLLGTIAAGAPIEAVTNPDSIAVPADLVGRRKAFALRVKGDSMIDEHICDGDVVIVEARDTARNGETVVALIDGHDATLKKFQRQGNCVKLIPANSAMDPIVVSDRELRIQGVVIGILRTY
ncbi:MAG: transcriptional repressor LexA [Deltaproteobacteria bacterium]|nr:transcriptional repressor LexA [Deltaproteobacteria bacterium]